MITYILKSIALYHIGKREGVKAYGLAWVPFLSSWVLGGIADKQDAANMKPDRKFRVFNLVISILGIAAAVLIMFMCAAVIAKIGLDDLESGAAIMNLSSLGTRFFALIGGMGILAFLLLAAVGIMASASTAVTWVCNYKLFDLCRPTSVLVSLVVTALFPGFGYAIVLMCNKNYRNDYHEI